MKKLILIIALLCISTSALAVEPIDWSKTYALSTAIQAVVSAGGAAAPSCSTSNDSSVCTACDTTGTGQNNLQTGTGGQQFVLTATYTITEYKINLIDYSAVAETFTCALYNDSSNTIGTIVSGTSVTKDKADVPDSMGLVTFTLGTPKTGLTAGTYWLACHADGNHANLGVGLYLGNPSGYILYGCANIDPDACDATYSNSYSIPFSVFGCAE